jgi:hypothetical protein
MESRIVTNSCATEESTESTEMSFSVLSVHFSVAAPFGILPPLERIYHMRNSIVSS